MRDPDDRLRQACQATDQAWALVRPDSYLAATGADVVAAAKVQSAE